MTTPVDNLRLSDQAADAIQNANRLVNRDRALVMLADLLNPSRDWSTWRLAGEISGHQRRFRSTAWPRIQTGHREPQNALETALMHCCAGDCPSSQRRVFDLLVDLRL